MTKIAYYQQKMDYCITMAIKCMHNNEVDLAAFYSHAADGYQKKMESVQDVNEEI